MNIDTGRIRMLKDGEKPQSDEIQVNIPDPNCLVCSGRGTQLVNIRYGNRAEHRRAIKAHLPMQKYLPCKRCCGGTWEYLI